MKKTLILGLRTYLPGYLPRVCVWGNPNPAQGPGRSAPPRAPLSKAAKPPEDNRILIAVAAQNRLKQPSPLAIRQAICAAVEGLTLTDIPRATTTRVKARLMKQENQALMVRAVEGDSARLPTRWINYAVQGVPGSFRSVSGALIPTSQKLVDEEVYSQT